MGSSSSIHCDAAKVKRSLISSPLLGLTVKRPGLGGPFVVTVTDEDAVSAELERREACSVKVRVALGGSEFGAITRLTSICCSFSAGLFVLHETGVVLMSANSRVGSDIDQVTVPESESCTMAFNTKLAPLLTLLLGVNEEVMVTMGADGDTIVTKIDALADRLVSPSVTRREKVDMVFADCGFAVELKIDFESPSNAKVVLQFEVYTGSDCMHDQM